MKMTNPSRSVRLVLRRVLMAVGVGSAALALQACYGVSIDAEYPPENASGMVSDKVTGKPIPAIRVTNCDNGAVTETGSDGSFSISTSTYTIGELKFEDVDGEANGNYGDKVLKNVDTTTQTAVQLSPFTEQE